ncbi:tripartite tricarboxylate transporter substrate binding protein [Variovorax sp. J22R115]|uniref:Bug family tripartite tricarboxylate transporter substrate binding protein n=1 Tax=Variovorax sp. J22R115 TaxID=3053509 RepID=UPI002577DB49|nr:tripartite tricarboxylate transporter substrate binding protein [Variovorax sp. J22R115]MDM0053579.1 tripartite tricarboxylate transporter substrate binding protein [Variovorax sp. J22R115]
MTSREMLVRRRLLGAAAGVAGLASLGVQAQPVKRPVTVYCGFPPGAAVDTVARLVTSNLEGLGNLIVENKAGAGGVLVAGIVARAEPNGSVLLFSAYAGLVTAKAVGRSDVVDLTEELTPIAYIGPNTNLIVVRAGLPVTDFKSFLAYAKTAPNGLTVGTNGIGGSYHLGLEQLNALAGVKLIHVPYKGGGPAMQDMLGGRLDAMFATYSLAKPHMAAGKLRPIAVANNVRFPQLPDLPTVAESGFPGYSIDGGMGFFAPRGVPAEVVKSVNDAVAKLLAEARFRERLLAEGVIPTPMAPSQFKVHLNAEVDKARDIIKKNRIQLTE